MIHPIHTNSCNQTDPKSEVASVYFPSGTRGLFGSGDIPKWLGVATEKVVAKRLV
jgi:hypothetical protein